MGAWRPAGGYPPYTEVKGLKTAHANQKCVPCTTGVSLAPASGPSTAWPSRFHWLPVWSSTKCLARRRKSELLPVGLGPVDRRRTDVPAARDSGVVQSGICAELKEHDKVLPAKGVVDHRLVLKHGQREGNGILALLDHNDAIQGPQPLVRLAKEEERRLPVIEFVRVAAVLALHGPCRVRERARREMPL